MQISLVRPLPKNTGRVSQWFGENPENYKRYGLFAHNGIDYACRVGMPILAMHDGKIELRSFDLLGYGLYLLVLGKQYDTLYAHLSSIIVANDEHVSAGQQIANSGNTGNSTGPHVHIGLRIHNMRNPGYYNYVDPVPFRDV